MINTGDARRNMPSSPPGNLGVYDTRIRVLIVDDHALMRQMLSDVLAVDEGIDVIARAANGVEALRLVAEVQPDMMVLDFAMPGESGIDVMRALRKQWSLPVLMISVHAQPSLVQWARRVGAQGFLPKMEVARSLEAAIRAVCEWRSYFGGEHRWAAQA